MYEVSTNIWRTAEGSSQDASVHRRVERDIAHTAHSLHTVLGTRRERKREVRDAPAVRHGVEVSRAGDRLRPRVRGICQQVTRVGVSLLVVI